jgi:hypothetical protein
MRAFTQGAVLCGWVRVCRRGHNRRAGDAWPSLRRPQTAVENSHRRKCRCSTRNEVIAMLWHVCTPSARIEERRLRVGETAQAHDQRCAAAPRGLVVGDG